MSVHALRAVAARFERDGHEVVPPFSLELLAGERVQLRMPNARAASVAARMAGGVVKATRGTLFIGDFDPRIQPVQAKRLVGFVPRGGGFGGSRRLPWISRSPHNIADGRERCEVVDFHAALYEVEREVARRRVRAVLSAVGVRDDAGFALALALIRPVVLLVLDEPSASLEQYVAEVVAPHTAVLTTIDGSAAKALGTPLAEAMR
jgi:ABC-type multidrug transport system ATPase subunit